MYLNKVITTANEGVERIEKTKENIQTTKIEYEYRNIQKEGRWVGVGVVGGGGSLKKRMGGNQGCEQWACFGGVVSSSFMRGDKRGVFLEVMFSLLKSVEISLSVGFLSLVFVWLFGSVLCGSFFVFLC